MWSRQRGIGLLELMLSLSILSIITVMSVSYYQSASRSQRLAQATAMISDIYAAAKDFVKFSTEDMSIEKMVDAGLLTTYYETNPWGGDNEASLKDSSLTIKMEGLRHDPCQSLKNRIKQTISSDKEKASCIGSKKRLRNFTVRYELY